MAAIQALGRRFLHALGVPTEAYRVFTDREIARALAARGWHLAARRINRD